MSGPSELHDRLSSVEQRVAFLERVIGVDEPAPPPEPERAAPPAPCPAPTPPAERVPVLTLAPPPAVAPPPARPRRDWFGDRDVERWLAANALALAGGVFVILGAAFFVAVAISNGWLTPPRQVDLALAGAAVLAVAGVRLHGREGGLGRRAWARLGEALVATAGAVGTLAVVAGARIYDEPLYGANAGLLGTAAIAAGLVAASLLWRAPIGTALGLGSALLAPVLVDAPATDATAVYVGTALLAAGVVVWRTGWTWLAWLAAAATGPQLAVLLDESHAGALAGDPSLARLAGVHALLLGWWAVLALPVVARSILDGWHTIDGLTRSLLTALLGGTVLLAAVAFGDVSADGVGVALAGLAVAHLAVAAAALVLAPEAARGPALFVASLAGVAVAGAVAILVGGPLQPVLWAAECALLAAVARRESDLQAAAAAALALVLAVAAAAVLSPPIVLVTGAEDPVDGAVAWGAVALALVWLLRLLPARPAREAAFAGALVAGLLAAGGVVVSLLTPAAGGDAPVDAEAQLVLAGLVAVVGAVLVAVAPRLGELRDVAASLGVLTILVAAAATLAERAALETTTTNLLLAALAWAAGVVVAVELDRRREADDVLPVLPAPLLAAAGLVVAIGGREAALLGTTALGPAAMAGAAVAATAAWGAWRLRDDLGAVAFAAAVVAALHTAAVAVATALTSGPEPDALAQHLVSAGVGAAALGLVLLATRTRVLPDHLEGIARDGGLALLLLVPLKVALVDWPTGLGPVAAGFALAWAVLWLGALVASERLDDTRPGLLVHAYGGLVAVLAVVAAPPDVLAHGTDGLPRAALALLVLAVAATVAARRADGLLRGGLAALAGVTVLYGASAAVVTALTPHAGQGPATQAGQLGLSLTWALAGLALVAVGLVRRGAAAVLVRRCGTALLAVAAVKVVALDTAQLDLGHRAAVFLAVGGAFLVGAYLYVRLARPEPGDDELVDALDDVAA